MASRDVGTGLLRVGAVLALAGAGALLLVTASQDSMIYFPTRQNESEAVRRASSAGLEPWRSAEGQIIGWRRVNPSAAARLVAFHGNAGSALDRGPYVEAFAPFGWEVMIFEYPGYGARPGRPGKDAFIASARTACDELIAADPRPIYLLGESIGAGTACAVLQQSRGSVAGALLVVPFARLIEVAQMHYGFLAMLLRDRFDNIRALDSSRVPVAFVVAGNDEVVGAEQGRKLHAAYQGPKLLVELPGVSHNGFPVASDVEWVRAVDAFLRPH